MSTRKQLVEAAADLFYGRGIHSSGIDAVVERSGFSKPTLYKHFRSKDELVTAVLEMRAARRQAAIEEAVSGAVGAREALDRVVGYFVSWYRDEDFRGCALVNGAVELPDPSHPGRDAVRRHKAWMTRFLAGLASDAGLDDPRGFAEAFVLLEEGATVMAYVGTERSVGRQLRRATDALLAAHGGE